MRCYISFVGIAFLLASKALGPGRVYAADSIAEAKAEFQQGREAFERKDFQTALERFRKSQELHPTSGTMLNLALTEEQLGMVLSASGHLQEVIAQLSPKDGRVALAKERLAVVEPRIPSLQILTCNAPPGMRVLSDGRIVAGERLGPEFAVEPGLHSIVVSVPGRPDRKYDVNVEEGKHHAIAIEPGQEPPPALLPSGAPTVQWSAAPRTYDGGMRRTAGFIAAGTGLAGLGVGAVTGLLAMGIKGDVDELCPGTGPCSKAGVAFEDTGRTLAMVSTVSFVIGAAGAGAGALLLLWGGGEDGSAKASASVGVSITMGGASLGVRGRF